ncbi:Scr1 family TA system antitoxin-like transcriptional regulator [Nocardia sp. NPDC050193]
MTNEDPTTDAGVRLLRGYEPYLIPAQLQTLDYTTAVLRARHALGSRSVDDRDLDGAVSARRAQHADWRPRGGEAHLLISEQALYTTVGNRHVMVAQLEILQEVLEEPDPIEVFILPLHAQFVGPATNFLFYDESHVTVETATCQVTITDPQALACYETLFEQLTAQSSSYHGGLKLVTTALRHHLRSDDSR